MLDSYQDLIDELLGTPKIVRHALSQSTTADMTRLVAAMRSRDRLVLERVQTIKQFTDPHLKPLPTDEALLISSTPGEDPLELADSFDIARGDLVSLLMNLTLKDWSRTATTDAEGIVSLADEVESHVEFDEVQRALLASWNG